MDKMLIQVKAFISAPLPIPEKHHRKIMETAINIHKLVGNPLKHEIRNPLDARRLD